MKCSNAHWPTCEDFSQRSIIVLLTERTASLRVALVLPVMLMCFVSMCESTLAALACGTGYASVFGFEVQAPEAPVKRSSATPTSAGSRARQFALGTVLPAWNALNFEKRDTVIASAFQAPEQDADSSEDATADVPSADQADQADQAEPANQAQQPAAIEPKRADAGVADDPLLARTYRKAMLIDVRGAIFGGLRAYVINRLEAAERGNCDLIILRITSPGGERDASVELAWRLSEIDWATTIAYVPEEAYSGAAIMALGCDRIFMRPRALIGDAGPIRMHGGVFEHAEEKAVSDLAATVNQLAISKKRPGAIAEAMVDRKLMVYEARNRATGARTYLPARDTAIPAIKQEYDIGAAIPESGQNRFLTVGGARAVELMIAEGTFESERELLAALHVDQIVETHRSWVDQSVYVLNLPFVSGLLLLIGLIGLYVEFSVPGISVAGLISLLCFGLFFWSHALGGTSGWLEVMMFALGIGCLGIELFVLPGFGVFGVTGLILIVLSLVMASQDFILPQSTVEWTTLRNNLLIVLGAVFSLIIALIVHVAFFDSIPWLGRFQLEAPDVEPVPAGESISSLVTGSSASLYLPEVGDIGESDSVLRPAGKVRFGGRLVDVVTEGDFLDPGTKVEVIKREGNHVVVRRLV